MATKDPVRKFAEQALEIDKLLNQHGVNGNAGRVILILSAASKPGGITQKRVIAESSFPKDVVSKQVRVLIGQGLLIQKREPGNSQAKRLYSTDAGKEILSAVREILRPTHEAKQNPDPDGIRFVQGTFDLE